MGELARRAEAASKIQAGVSSVAGGNSIVGHSFVRRLHCVITETLCCC